MQESASVTKVIEPYAEVVDHNPKYEELFAPVLGPVNPFRTKQLQMPRNTLSGNVEAAHISEFQFENQRRTFNSFGFAADPSVADEGQMETKVVCSSSTETVESDKTVFEKTKPSAENKRKRKKNNDPEDIDGFLGPWGGYVDEQRVMKPTPEEAAELVELVSKRNKSMKPTEPKIVEEKTTLHSEFLFIL